MKARRIAPLAVAVALLAPAAASADAGKTVLKLDAGAWKSLGEAGVKLGGGERRVELPIRGGEAGGVARLEYSGGLAFRAGNKRVSARGLEGTLSSHGSQITGRIGGTQYTLITLAGVEEGDYDPLTGEVAVDDARARLDGNARTELQRRLGGARLPAKLGTARIRAALEPASVPEESPPLLQRPAGAIDIASAELTWRARESWVDYLHAAGEQGGTSVSDGATNGPAEVIPPSSQARVYEFGYPFSQGWFDPATGFAGAYFTGTVNFHKLIDPFQIDLDVKGAEIELTGETSRAIFTLQGRRNNSDQRDRRAVAVDLDPAAVTPTVTSSAGATTYTYERIPATVPDGPTAWPIASFYTAGSPWGSVSISFTVPGAAP